MVRHSLPNKTQSQAAITAFLTSLDGESDGVAKQFKLGEDRPGIDCSLRCVGMVGRHR
jgi:hypothetical protein